MSEEKVTLLLFQDDKVYTIEKYEVCDSTCVDINSSENGIYINGDFKITKVQTISDWRDEQL